MLFIINIQVRGHVKDDSRVVESFIGQDSRDTTGFLMTSDPTWYLNPKVYTSKMAADIIFFCIYKLALMTCFRVKIILNFLHDEDIRTNLYAYKRILNRLPFMNVYCNSKACLKIA